MLIRGIYDGYASQSSLILRRELYHKHIFKFISKSSAIFYLRNQFSENFSSKSSQYVLQHPKNTVATLGATILLENKNSF